MLTASVGQGGRNLKPDVMQVQQLLVKNGAKTLKADGSCGPKTVAAIKDFQKSFMKLPDGLVSPSGATWSKLSGGAPAIGGAQPAAGSAVTDQIPMADIPSVMKQPMNAGVSAASNTLMLQLFGPPRLKGDYSAVGGEPDNPVIAKHLDRVKVGRLSARGLAPAVRSLRMVLEKVRLQQPEVYGMLQTAGMLNCRLQRGSSRAISNHSWGTAIDLYLEDAKGRQAVDARGDNKVLRGLALIAPIFNQAGWYWGAAFGTEDGMHFEGGKALVEQWAAELKAMENQTRAVA